MKFGAALRLGRVSNLPTVWTNVLAGVVLAGAGGFGAELALLLAAFTLFYTGGMFLNDAFDAGVDARERPERPIPAGAVGAREVFAWGFGQMAAGVALLAVIGVAPALAGLTLAAAITYYDWNHKTNPLSPVVMGLCRVFIYLGAGLAYTLALPDALWIGAALLLCYLIGLTYVAKQENLARVENLWPLLFLAAPAAYGAWLAAAHFAVAPFWLLFTGWMLVALWFLRRRRKGDIPRAVVSLIAGISLLDALLIAGAGSPALAVLALAGFGVTLFFQRYISGT
ncbi:MAG: UbiA family prenyltransferase [Betaproteobacteria bacterium]|nr:UbiA family prenyltransferase [Betaproteobacteria bacterium]MDH4322643.1 UbiA family prenyltransferase [Betaproteobacteria bacterium]MDH5210066.1 UbiA family prenyltransferase [Betaproteobacteria bacterium]MDH5579560.1 UbiA family prenyltransferase [Betaproteobacteria bacterium]